MDAMIRDDFLFGDDDDDTEKDGVQFIRSMIADSDDDDIPYDGVQFIRRLIADSDDSEDSNKPPRQPQGNDLERDPTKSRFQDYVDLADQHEEDGTSIWDDTTTEGKKFRQRFRLPYDIFDKVCQKYENADTRNEQDEFHRPKSDTRLLILGVLRVLGSSTSFDDVEELNDISTDKNNDFFKQFVHWIAQSEYADKYLKYPESVEDLAHVTDHYGSLLLPGCAGSVDRVHVASDMCPAGLRSDCKGKKGYPSLSFQVIASHTRKIRGVSGPYYGTWNDKTIARLDDNFKLFMTGGALADKTWTWTDENGTEHEEKGLFLICDGGDHSWKMLINPFRGQPGGSREALWSGLVASLRKDIGCLLGILKKRFMILKHPMRFHNMELISDIFRTCCIFHNMLLEYDGYDDWRSSAIVDRNSVNAANANSEHSADHQRQGFARSGAALHHLVDGNKLEKGAFDDFNSKDFNDRRESLIRHYIANRRC